MEAHQNVPSEKLPPVTVTVASNDVDFIVKYVLVFCCHFVDSNTIEHCDTVEYML